MTMPAVALIGVPSSAGARRTGQEKAPAAFRAAGLLERLHAKGLDVADLGDLPSVSFRPDPEHPRQQNVNLVVDVARQTADRVDRAVGNRRLPLVLGGDCTIGLGVISGLLRYRQRLGLLYFDGDVDLNTPESTPSGIFDGMVMAHVLGRGDRRLAGIGPRRPLLSEENIVLFGYDEESGFIDPPEREILERSRMSKYPLDRVRTDTAVAASEALRSLQDRSGSFLVHFDVDVTNCRAADVHHPRGLDAESTFAALEVFVASPACAAVVVTELNAEKDAEGCQATRLVHGLLEALGARKE